MIKTKSKIQTRKTLSADGLFEIVHKEAEKIKEHRVQKVDIPLSDVIMSAFAMFSLKEPSLYSFDEKRNDENLKNIYKIWTIPSDTGMRTILDWVNTNDIHPIFKKVFTELQRWKWLEDMVFHEWHYLLSNDWTWFFSSNTIHCECCMEKKDSKTWEVKSYYHQFLWSCIVHPDNKVVIPIAPEPIVKQDGDNKNDCERNAGKRFLKSFRKDHPHLKVIITEDALASNAPHIKDLNKYDIRYILWVKQWDHKFLFEYVNSDKCNITEYEYKDNKWTIHKFNFVNKVPLNASNQDVLVNFIEYWEIKEDWKKQHFSWVTDIEVTKDNVFKLMRGWRARWKIENETFNTLKNQWYKFEHNFGHWKKNLSNNFGLIMMLAFLVDQVQQKICPLFKATLEKCKTKRSLWEKMRAFFYNFICFSMKEVREAILYWIKRTRISEVTWFNSS